MHDIAHSLISVLNAWNTLLSKQLIKRKHYRGSINDVNMWYNSY